VARAPVIEDIVHAAQLIDRLQRECEAASACFLHRRVPKAR
jgi:hypothetical protein